MCENITEIFLDEIIKLSEKDLPEHVRVQTKMSIIDYMACIYLGEYELHNETLEYMDMFGQDTGNAPVVGTGRNASTHMAALLNGMNAHVSELDDGHRYGMLHLAAPVISTLLAVANEQKLSGEAFLKGIVMGYEAAIRLASAIQPGHKLKGYHATGTCGTIGAAVGLAIALNYNRDQLKATISAAATDAAGLLAAIDDESRLKPYNIGRAAVAAINAAYVGKIGMNGPEDILGGNRGFFKATAKDVKEQYIRDGFEGSYAIELIYRKPYAACRHCHAAIEAAINVEYLNQISVKSIETIKIETYNLAVHGHDHKDVKGPSSAKMSIPYSVAVGVVYGKADYEQFTSDYIEDSDIIDIMNKIEVLESEELSALVPEKRGAIATIVADGKSFSHRVDYPKGEPENPIEIKELEQKYYSLVKASGRDEVMAAAMLESIWNIEDKFAEFMMRL